MATKTKAKLNLRPLGDRVILERAEAEEKTAGGILLPESAKEEFEFDVEETPYL